LADRKVAGAEVVDGDRGPELAERREGRRHAFAFVRQCLRGDAELKGLPRQAGLIEHPGDSGRTKSATPV